MLRHGAVVVPGHMYLGSSPCSSLLLLSTAAAPACLARFGCRDFAQMLSSRGSATTESLPVHILLMLEWMPVLCY